MTQKIRNMSKGELISNIAKTETIGKELESMCSDIAKTYADIMAQGDRLKEQMDSTMETMRNVALANAEMRRVLRDKYGTFVM